MGEEGLLSSGVEVLPKVLLPGCDHPKGSLGLRAWNKTRYGAGGKSPPLAGDIRPLRPGAPLQLWAGKRKEKEFLTTH